MTKIMFDTNAFDKILDGTISIDLIKKSLSLCYEYHITPIQVEELSNIPDSKKDKRAIILLFLSDIAPRLIPTESAVYDVSRFNFAKMGDGILYEKLLNKSRNNIKDALIGETAIKNDIILITEDDDFKSKIKKLGGTALKVNEFKDMINDEL